MSKSIVRKNKENAVIAEDSSDDGVSSVESEALEPENDVAERLFELLMACPFQLYDRKISVKIKGNH